MATALQILQCDKQNTIKLPKATHLQFSPANNNCEIINGRRNKRDNMKLCVEEHEVQCCLLKQKWWIKHYTVFCAANYSPLWNNKSWDIQDKETYNTVVEKYDLLYNQHFTHFHTFYSIKLGFILRPFQFKNPRRSCCLNKSYFPPVSFDCASFLPNVSIPLSTSI